LAKAPATPVAMTTSATSDDSDYTSTMLGVLVNEVLNGPTGRYLRLGDKSKEARFSEEADVFFERSADGKSIVIDINPGLYRDVEHGISTLRKYLDRVFRTPELAENVGGLLVVTQIAPRPAIDDFVKQITEPPAPIPVVLADVTGLEQSDRLIDALRQASFLPGQDYG